MLEPGKGPRPLGLLHCAASWPTEMTRKSTRRDGVGDTAGLYGHVTGHLGGRGATTMTLGKPELGVCCHQV